MKQEFKDMLEDAFASAVIALGLAFVLFQVIRFAVGL